MWFYFTNALFTAMAVTGWQGFKDTPYEGFEIKKYIRSYVVAFALIPIIYLINLQQNYKIPVLVLCFLSLSLERGIGELYKGLIRKKSHKEYLHLINKLELKLDNPMKRRLIALLLVLLIIPVIILFNFALLVLLNVINNPLILGVCLGIIGGLLPAIGGATKDAQFEGFKIKKFIRSPAVGALGGFVLSKYVFIQPLVFVVCVSGFERLFVELYKTFISRQIRGIHEDVVKVNNFWLRNRWVFFVQYLTAFTYFVAIFFI